MTRVHNILSKIVDIGLCLKIKRACVDQMQMEDTKIHAETGRLQQKGQILVSTAAFVYDHPGDVRR